MERIEEPWKEDPTMTVLTFTDGVTNYRVLTEESWDEMSPGLQEFHEEQAESMITWKRERNKRGPNVCLDT